jgi:hypothetical protein
VIDRLLVLLTMLVGYAVGYFAIRLAVAPFGLRAAAGAPPAYLLFLPPLVVCAVFEHATGLWERTPGSLGLGPLDVVKPMAVAGLATAAAYLALRAALPLPADLSPRETGALAVWAVASLALIALALALWRYWPPPMARLF